jgi:hypothetical protein
VSKYEWSSAYQEAESEHDMSNLENCVMAVENALFLRMQALNGVKHPSAEVHNELREIRAAVTGLLLIKTERLKWPGLDLYATQNGAAN